MARRIALKVALICALGLASVAVLALAPAPYPRLATVCPGPSYTSPNIPPDGSPAIRPRNDCTPSFTEQDARTHLQPEVVTASPLKVSVTGEPRIAWIRFVTLSDLRPVLDDPYLLSAFPADMVVCAVTVRGTFTFQAHIFQPVTTVNGAYLVFDAHSGNWLASGVFRQPG